MIMYPESVKNAFQMSITALFLATGIAYAQTEIRATEAAELSAFEGACAIKNLGNTPGNVDYANCVAQASAMQGAQQGLWDCPDARIELRKYAVHVNELKISVPIAQVNPIRANVRADVKQLRDGTVILNGKRCRPVESEEDK